MSTTYTRNPYNVEAIQYTGDNDSELRDFGITFTRTLDAFVITMSTGVQEANPTDWIVRRTYDGRIMVVTDAAFTADYTLYVPPEEP